MPHSVAETNKFDSSNESVGQRLAQTAEILFLLNLLLLPGIAFIFFLFFYLRFQHQSTQLARCHLRQTFFANIWAGMLLLIIPGLVILYMFIHMGNYDAPSIWIMLILYFITVHASLVLLGSLGLARAMAGKHYHYPFIRHTCPESIPESTLGKS